MPRRRKNNDIRLTVIGDLEGMTVGRLRELLDGISDDTEIEIDEDEWPDFRSENADFHLIIRKD